MKKKRKSFVADAVFRALVLACLPMSLGAYEVRQVRLESRHTQGNTNVGIEQSIDMAAWVWMPGHDVWGASFDGKFDPDHEPAFLFRFRRDFEADGSVLQFSVSADERFVLMLDGRVIARGPHRGSVNRWYYQTYEITGLGSGTHRLEAICWQLGAHAPIAQLSWRGGFILKAEETYDAQLTTGRTEWRCAPLANTTFSNFGTGGAWGAGSQCEQVGTSFLREEPPAERWKSAVVVRRPIREKFNGIRQEGWRLFPTERADQLAEPKTPGKVVNATVDLTRPFVVPADSERDLWWDLENYYCAYPELETAGGKDAEISWGWTESLRNEKGEKGDRNAWRGKAFSQTVTDTFRPDGRPDALFTSPWWRCGRWCRLHVKTSSEPLTVRSVRIVETRYPLAFEGLFESDDPTLGDIGRICRRAIEECTHETLFDCPFYEQQMYPGDSRIQLLIHSAITREDSMARFALTFFDADRRSDGFVAMNFPTRATQESATYTMCWVLMHRDYMMWHDNAAFLRARMPGVRNALMGLALHENADGLLEDLPGWSFMDWVDGWSRTNIECRGVAPDGTRGEGAGALNGLLYQMALQAAGDVDAALGEEHLAAHWRAKADRLGKKLVGRFWDEGRGLMADTVRKDRFSEHAQCLAILTGILSKEQADRAFAGLLSGRDLAVVSSYFAHYLFETYAKCGRTDLIRRRLDLWRQYLRHGACTAFEKNSMESRSDCHGWSACPLYFYQTAFAGVRPDAPFFKSVRIAPQPAGLRRIRSKTPCHQGVIETDLSFENGRASGKVTLPAGLTGTLVYGNQTRRLVSGENVLGIAREE